MTHVCSQLALLTCPRLVSEPALAGRTIPHMSSTILRCKVILLLLFAAVGSTHCFPQGSTKVGGAGEETWPRFSKPMANATAVFGRSAVLECSVENLGPFNKVAWLKMDSSNSEPTVLTIGTQALFGESKYRVTHNGHRQWYLHIKHVRVSDKGGYMCQVNAKSMISQVGFLHVQVPPIIIEERTSSDTTVDEHHKAVLKCTAKGYPRPKISWRREDNRPINLGLAFGGVKNSAPTFEGDQLNLTQVTRDDMGAYLCIASNQIPPSVSKRILLHVNFRPKIKVTNQIIRERLGTAVELMCQCEAYPRPLVTWIAPSGSPIMSATSGVNSSSTSSMSTASGTKYEIEEDHQGYRTTMKLKIKALSTEDLGTFKCMVKNIIGEKEGLIRLYESDSRSNKNPASILRTSKNAKANSLKSRKSRRQQYSQSQQFNGTATGTVSQAEEEEDEFEEDGDMEGGEAFHLDSNPVQSLRDTSSGQATMTATHRTDQTVLAVILAVTVALTLKWASV